MLKKDLISFYKNSLQGVDKTSRYHDNVITYAVRMAYEQLLYDLYYNDPKNLDEYVVTLSGLVIIDATKPYATLTASPIKLPGKASGVRSIRNDDYSFMPVSIQDYDQASSLELWESETNIGYSVGQGKVYFYNMPDDWDYLSNSIDIDIIQSFEEYADTDEIVIPHGQAERMTELVMTFLSKIPPKNLLNNNNG